MRDEQKRLTAKVVDPGRKREWEAILGSDTVQIKSMLPERVNLPGMDDELVYELDLVGFTAEQRERLVNHLARKFDFSPEFVAARLEVEGGVPILAKDVVVTGYDIGVFL